MKRSGSRRLAASHYTATHVLYWMTLVAYSAYGAAYLYDIGLSSAVTGIVIAAAGLASAVLQSLLGALADRSKTFSTGRIATMLSVPATLLLFLLWLVPLSLPFRVVLYIVAWALLISVHFLINSCAMECAEAGVRVNYGASRAMGSLGYAVTSYATGLVIARTGISITLPIAAFLATLLTVVLSRWQLMPRGLAARKETEAGAPPDNKRFFRRYPRYLVFVSGSFLMLMAYYMLSNYLVRIVGNLGGGSKELGTLILISACSEIPTILFSMQLVKRFGCRRLVLLSVLMFTVQITLMTVAPRIELLYAVMTLQACSYSLYTPVCVYYVDTRMHRSDKVKGQATMALTSTAASATGALVGGILLDVIGLSGMMLTCVVTSLVGGSIVAFGTEKV